MWTYEKQIAFQCRLGGGERGMAREEKAEEVIRIIGRARKSRAVAAVLDRGA
jgi:hypothetical protein